MSQTTNAEIAKAITSRLLDRHIIKSKGRDMEHLRSHVEREIGYVLVGMRIDPWPENIEDLAMPWCDDCQSYHAVTGNPTCEQGEVDCGHAPDDCDCIKKGAK